MRPDFDNYFMNMAIAGSLRATCIRRKVGCILVNDKHFIIGTGYNGVAPGASHCNHESLAGKVSLDPDAKYPFACSGATSPSGEDLDNCEAIHAEQNALLQCRNVHEIETAYVTASPCITCIKLLLATSCKMIVFKDIYPHWSKSKILWEQSGRKWKHLTHLSV